MTMKIEEMSIGDWFMIEREPAKIIKLAIVGGLKLMGKSGRLYNILGGDLTPIPITRRLLKQIATKTGEWSYMFCDGVFFDTNTTYKWIERLRVFQGRTDFTVRGKIRYVHQLQHLLHIAGVEKEITFAERELMVAKVTAKEVEAINRSRGVDFCTFEFETNGNTKV